MKFTKSHVAANRGTTTYSSPEAAGVIGLPKSFNGGVHPEVLEVTGFDAQGAEVAFAPRKEKKAPETPEQRKARLAELRAKQAQLTPEQKLAAKKERAAKALARAEAAIAKAQAKSAQGAAPTGDVEQPQGETAAQ